MTNTLMDLSNALAATVKTADSSIVRIEARRRLPATGFVWSEAGIIITAHHVVRKDEQITIGLGDGQTVKAKLIGRDPSTDLAVLQAEASGLTPLVEANKNDLGVGHFVLALGRPGKTVQATLGIISAWGDAWRTRWGGKIDNYLQTDVIMYPGFSGGPLINGAGQLVGMNTSGLSQGVSLAIPATTLARVTDALMAHGRVKRGYLGVSTQRAKLPDLLAEALGQRSGLLVISVENGSPAELGGLTLGDTIVAIGDEAVRHHDDLLAGLTSDRVNTAVPLKIIRGGKVETVDVTIGEHA